MIYIIVSLATNPITGRGKIEYQIYFFRKGIVQPTEGIQSTQTTAFDENVMTRGHRSTLPSIYKKNLRLLYYEGNRGSLKMRCCAHWNLMVIENNNNSERKTITASVS